MYTVIGLGGIGCRVATEFLKYSQYNVLCIDDASTGHCDELLVPASEKPEEYEENFPTIPKKTLAKIKEDVIVVLSGSSYVCAGALRMLYQIKDRNITIIYVQPELDLLEERKSKQERVISSVLQEYTRSGIFSKMYLTSNGSIDKLVCTAGIKDYYPAINSLISSVFHMMEVFDRQPAEVSSFSRVNEARRICTMGVLDTNTAQEKMFFPLDNTMDSRLYYGISENSLNSNSNLQREIIETIKQKNREFNKYSYGVYGTQYDYDFCYVKSYSSKVQEL